MMACEINEGQPEDKEKKLCPPESALAPMANQKASPPILLDIALLSIMSFAVHTVQGFDSLTPPACFV